MKIILLILLTFSSHTFAHSAKNGDFLGTWRLVEFATDDQYQDVPTPTPIKMYMNGEFVILYGWANPRGIPNYDALPVPAPEPDPADGSKNRIVIPLNGAGTGGQELTNKQADLFY